MCNVDKPSVSLLSISRSVQPTEQRNTCLPYLHTGEQQPMVYQLIFIHCHSLDRHHVSIAALLSLHEHHLRCGLRSFRATTLVLPIYTHVITGECGVTSIHSPSLCSPHSHMCQSPAEHVWSISTHDLPVKRLP